jgi:hypothetical protein
MDGMIVVGIDSKGYGKVYKKAMKDPNLSLTAKGLLAYLCAYAGNGTSAFPKREKILRDMVIGKDTFSKHIAILESVGYIFRHRTVSGTLYEIFSSIPDADGNLIELKSTGYGTIPKLAVLDVRLSVKAKAVYAYMCSYAGAGHIAYPHVGTILRDLKISKNAYYSYYNELSELGYISTEQRIDDKGRYGATTYRLNEFVSIEGALSYSSKTSKPHNNAATTYPNSATQNSFTVSTDVENCVESQLPTDTASEKMVSGKTVSQKPGHANINNNLITNSSLSYDKEEKKNNIRLPGLGTPVENSAPHTLSEVREWMRYQEIMTECIAWASLKQTLGQFALPNEKQVFINQNIAVADEMAYQLQRIFSSKGALFFCGNRKYENPVLRKQLSAHRKELSRICIEISEASGRIRSLRLYVRAVLINLAATPSGDCSEIFYTPFPARGFPAD